MADNSTKISQLPIANAAAGTDRLVILRTPNNNPSVRTISLATLQSNLSYANTTSAGVIKVGNNLTVNATGFLNAEAGGNANTGNFNFVDNVMSLDVSNNMIFINNPNNGIQIGGQWLTQMSATSNAQNVWGDGNTQAYSWVYQDHNEDFTSGYAEHGAYVQNSASWSQMYLTTDPTQVFYITAHDESASPAIQTTLTYSANGILNLANTGDITRNGKSVLPPVLTPNIAYTGVFNGYPAVLPVTYGQNVVYTSNNALAADTRYWFWNDQFWDGNYDLSGTTSITLQNIGGIQGNFNFGNKSNPVLETIDLGPVSYIRNNFYLHNMSSLANFYANNVTYVGGDIDLYSFNRDVNLYFNNLSWVGGTFYLQYNSNLTTIPSFPSLQKVNQLYIDDNSSLAGTLAFPALTYCPYIYFYNNYQLSLSCNQLPSTQYIGIYNNNTMNQISFDALQTCMGEIQIYNNANMESPPTFGSLQYCYSRIYMDNNPQMTSAPAFPSLIEIHGTFEIPNCTSMTTGFNFSELKMLTSNFSAYNCALDESSVDYILGVLVSLDGTNGTTLWNHDVNLSGGTNAIPSAAGLASKAILEARGCNVYVNS